MSCEAPTLPSRSGILRVLLHAAAVLPLLIMGGEDMARGWRPLFDNAYISLRAFQVFSRASPLVGHQAAFNVGSHTVFGPGPVENWLLAVPVRLDPGQGALWGAVIIAGIGVTLAIEAAWSAAQWWGAVLATAAILVTFAVLPELTVDVVWNAWFGLIFVYPTLLSGWAVASGHLRWWPVTVASATVVVQSQEVFAPPVILVCLVSALMGWIVNRSSRSPGRYRPFVVGVAVGVVLWIAPVVQQFTQNPGNLTLLWEAATLPARKVGLRHALSALGGGVSPVPEWLHRPPVSGAYAQFVYVAKIFTGPAWWAIVTLAAVIVVAVTATLTGRRRMAGAAAVSLAGALGVVMSFSTVPASQFLNFGYLGTLLIPIGCSVWLTLAWAVGELLRYLASLSLRRFRPGRPSIVQPWFSVPGEPLRMVAASVAMIGTLVLAVSSGGDILGTAEPTLTGWTAVHQVDAGVAAAAAVAPHRPFRLQLEGPLTLERLGVITGMAYLLDADGFDARMAITITLPTFGPVLSDMPVVTVRLPSPHLIARATVRSPHSAV
jgi:hypothetical protein